MPEEQYEAELAKEAMAEFNAKADKLQATEREQIQQPGRNQDWIKLGGNRV